MKAILISLTKLVTIWITILFSSILISQFYPMNVGSDADGPLSGGQAFLLVNAAHAFIITCIAYAAKIRGFALGLLLGVTLFMAQSFLLMMEAVYFINDLKISQTELLTATVHAFVVSSFVGVVCSLLWRSAKNTVNTIDTTTHLPVRITLISLVYTLCYFIAGSSIAWASPDVQAYYSFGVNIQLLPLLSFQVLRGALWGVIAWLLVRSICGTTILRTIIVGGSFSVLAIAQLLYPSGFMPWEVRYIHMIEVGVSNYIFGSLAVIILLYKYRQPTPEKALVD